MDFVPIWYDDRYGSKVLFSNTLPMPKLIFSKPYDGFCSYSAIFTALAHGLKVKVKNLEILY